MSDLSIRDFKVSSSFKTKLIRIVTPFSIQFWLTIFLIYCFILINKHIISNTIVNLIYLFICIVILFF